MNLYGLNYTKTQFNILIIIILLQLELKNDISGSGLACSQTLYCLLTERVRHVPSTNNIVSVFLFIKPL